MKPTKLNLGSGYDYREGWLNLDIDPETSPDIVADLQAPLPFKSESIDEIDLQDVVEHVTKEQSQLLLAECHRVLRPKGKIRVRVPNVLTIINHFADDPEVMLEFMYGSTDQNGVWGAHKHGYTESSLKNRLKQIGFTQVKIAEVETNFEATAIKSTKTPNIHLMVIQQSPDWGGAEEWMAMLVEKSVASSHPVTTVTNLSPLKERFSKAGASVIHLPFILDISGNWKGLVKSALYFIPSVLWYLRLLFTAKRNGVSVILMSGFSEKLLVSWLSLLFNIPVVWYEYGPLDQVFKRNWYIPKLAYRFTKHIPKRVITISRNTKNNILPEARISLAKLRLFYPGVPIPKALPKKKFSKTVGSLSRLTPEKGQRILLQAWKEIIQQVPDATLVIAGGGKELEELKRIAQELSITDSVTFLGFIDDKGKFYNSIDLFVFPSVWEMEGFGIVTTEAMSFGVPVVGFKRGPLPEIISPASGALASATEPSQLAQTIVSLLKQPEALKEMGRHARDRAETRFNLDIQTDKVLTELEYVVREDHNDT